MESSKVEVDEIYSNNAEQFDGPTATWWSNIKNKVNDIYSNSVLQNQSVSNNYVSTDLNPESSISEDIIFIASDNSVETVGKICDEGYKSKTILKENGAWDETQVMKNTAMKSNDCQSGYVESYINDSGDLEEVIGTTDISNKDTFCVSKYWLNNGPDNSNYCNNPSITLSDIGITGDHVKLYPPEQEYVTKRIDTGGSTNRGYTPLQLKNYLKSNVDPGLTWTDQQGNWDDYEGITDITNRWKLGYVQIYDPAQIKGIHGSRFTHVCPLSGQEVTYICNDANTQWVIDDGVCGSFTCESGTYEISNTKDFDISDYLGNSKSLTTSQITNIPNVSTSISSKVADIITGGVTYHQITIPIENMDGLWKQVGDFALSLDNSPDWGLLDVDSLPFAHKPYDTLDMSILDQDYNTLLDNLQTVF